MEVCLIWAQARHRVIGRNNALPWHLPEDLKWFKETTSGHPVLMGRRTFESLPVRPLPGRLNIVLSRRQGWLQSLAGPSLKQASDLTSGLQVAEDAGHQRTFVIGGQAVFEAALPRADCVLLTEIDLEVEGADAFAPNIAQIFTVTEQGDWLTSSAGLRYRYSRWNRTTPAQDNDLI